MKKYVVVFLLLGTLAGCDRPESLSLDSRLLVYPNPVAQRLYMTVLHNGSPFTLTVFQPNGEYWFRVPYENPDGNSTDVNIDLAGNGTYHVMLEIDNVVIRRTIAKL